MSETAPPLSASDMDLGQALGTLLRSYLDGAREAVADVPGGPRGYQVMSIALDSTSPNQARMAETLGIDRTVMTYLVDDLEKAGLVVRRPDPADRRARQVVLTDEGRAVHAAARLSIDVVERAVLGSLSDADAAVFRDLLARVAGSSAVVDHACTVADDPCAGSDGVPAC